MLRSSEGSQLWNVTTHTHLLTKHTISSRPPLPSPSSLLISFPATFFSSLLYLPLFSLSYSPFISYSYSFSSHIFSFLSYFPTPLNFSFFLSLTPPLSYWPLLLFLSHLFLSLSTSTPQHFPFSSKPAFVFSLLYSHPFLCLFPTSVSALQSSLPAPFLLYLILFFPTSFPSTLSFFLSCFLIFVPIPTFSSFFHLLSFKLHPILISYTFSSQFSNFLPFLLLYVLSSLHTPVFCFLSPPNPTTSLFPSLDLPLLPLFLSFPSFPLFTFHFLSYSLFNLTFLSFPSSSLSSPPLLISFHSYLLLSLSTSITFSFFFLPILLISFPSPSFTLTCFPFFPYAYFPFLSLLSVFCLHHFLPLTLLCSLAFSYPFLLPSLPWHIFLSLFLLPLSFYLTSILSFLNSFLLITSPPSHFLFTSPFLLNLVFSLFGYICHFPPLWLLILFLSACPSLPPAILPPCLLYFPIIPLSSPSFTLTSFPFLYSFPCLLRSLPELNTNKVSFLSSQRCLWSFLKLM